MEATEALVELSRRVEEAEDDEVLADALSRRAGLYTAQGNYEAAEKDIKQASDVWFRLDRPQEHGRTEYARARIVAQADIGVSTDIFRRAAAISRLAGDTDYELKSREGAAAALGSLGDYAGSLAEYQATAHRLEELGEPVALVRNLRSQAALLQLVGRPNKALQAFDAAVETARGSGNEVLALEARIERRGAVNLTVSPDREALDELVAEAQRLGVPALAGQARLQLAAEHLREGRIDEAAQAAEQARQEALEELQPIMYLMACITLSEAREAQGDRPGVIEILLTCKQTIQNHFGREAAEPVLKLLDALEDRWGAQGLEQALVVYRERMSARMPQA